MSDENIEQRITDLEIKFTFQEDLLEQLNQVITEQHFEIQKLQKEINELKTMAAETQASGSETIDLKDEKPPHY